MVGGGMVMVTWESREDLRGCREDAPQGLGVAGPGEGALASLPWRPWILGVPLLEVGLRVPLRVWEWLRDS